MRREEAIGFGKIKAKEFIKYFEEKYPVDESLTPHEQTKQFFNGMIEGQQMRMAIMQDFRGEVIGDGADALAINDEELISAFENTFTDILGEWLKSKIDEDSDRRGRMS